MSTQYLNVKRKSSTYDNNLPTTKDNQGEGNLLKQSRKLIILNKKNNSETKNNTDHNTFFQVSTQNCIICNWRFPSQMTNEEKNVHLNFCIEGNGNQHKENYINSIRIILYNLKDKVEGCLICGEDLKARSYKSKQYHISQCLENQEIIN